jgi:hypothetical protein
MLLSVDKTFPNMLIICFEFPSWSSIKDWLKKEKHKLGLCDNVFNPCKENVIRNVSRFIFELPAELSIHDQSSIPEGPLQPVLENLPEITTDTNQMGQTAIDSRIVLAIDAVHLNSYCRVKEGGKVEGLINCNEICEQEAKSILTTTDWLTYFVNAHRQDIISNVFVIYGTRLRPEEKLFLVAVVPSMQGAADDERNQILRKVCHFLLERIEIEGRSSDVDKKHEIFSRT